MPDGTVRIMNRINWLFTATSLSVVLVSVERFSFTTRILLPPFDFLRLHELVQMAAIILVTVVIPALLFREVSGNFSALSARGGAAVFLVFVVGVYYYSTGNGVHELASFTFNTYCDTATVSGNLCGGLFINDFYTGNILFFVGGLLMNVALLVLERRNPHSPVVGGAFVVLLINAVVYAVTVVAYAGFDRVVVGLVYSVVQCVVALAFLLSVRSRYRQFPLITYLAVAYTLGAVASAVVRLR
ncbi:hypothetical protein ACQPWY_16590 [Pseudonocardia xinjiangensis]|uniref:hypothetical protein n=1 Tax=Pseudonocardia xinjiangensis TaxID=75289 RepID=UPI003D93005E